MKIDATVLKETRYMAMWVLIFSVLMQAVFLVLGKWNYTVLLGNLLSDAVLVGNFFLMGITVQRALEKEEKDAKATMKVSQLYRLLLLAAVLAVGVALPVFDTWAVVIPVIFPRLAIALRPFLGKDKQ